MSLANLIRKRETGKPANANPAKAANDWRVKGEPLARLATLSLANLPESANRSPATSVSTVAVANHKTGMGHIEKIIDAAEARRQKVIAMLNAAPEAKRVIVTDDTSDPDNVILTVAVRACQQTCELLIPKAKYDPWLLMALIERHSGTEH